MILVLVVVLPVVILMSMSVLAGVLGSIIRRSSAADHLGEDKQPDELLQIAESENAFYASSN